MGLLNRLKVVLKGKETSPKQAETSPKQPVHARCYHKDCQGKKDPQGNPSEQNFMVNADLLEPEIVYCNYCGEPIKIYKSSNGDSAFCTPSKDEMDWISFIQKQMRNTSDSIRDLAKYFISIDILLITTYTAALTFFNAPSNIPPGWFYWLYIILLAIPIGIWLISICISIYVFDGGKLQINTSEPNDIKKKVSTYNIGKYAFLQYSLYCLAFGIFAAILLLYLGITPHPTMVQFVVSNNGSAIMENLSIPMVNNTYETVPVELLETTNSSYLLKLSNGQIESFVNSPGIINGIIYDNNSI